MCLRADRAPRVVRGHNWFGVGEWAMACQYYFQALAHALAGNILDSVEMLVRFIVDTYAAAGEATLAALVANDFFLSAYNPHALGLEFRTRNDTYESVVLAFALQGRWSDAKTWLAACRRVATFRQARL